MIVYRNLESIVNRMTQLKIKENLDYDPGGFYKLSDMNDKILLFDLDGAISDPLEGIARSLKILEMFEIRHFFQFISGGDVGIPKWRQIESLIHDGSIDHNSIMIGDRDIDLTAAHKNGIRSAGVLWGYGSRTELEIHKPVCLLSKPADLLGLIRL